MEQKKTEIRVGKTIFIVTAECSPTATETIEQKLKKLINQHTSGDGEFSRKLLDDGNNQLAMCSNQSEYSQKQTRTGTMSYDEA